MRSYSIVTEKLDDGTKQYCLFDDKSKSVIARYATKAEAEEVLVRYTSAIDKLILTEEWSQKL